MRHMMERDYANVHRGVHILSQRATDVFEGCRARVTSLYECGGGMKSSSLKTQQRPLT